MQPKSLFAPSIGVWKESPPHVRLQFRTDLPDQVTYKVGGSQTFMRRAIEYVRMPGRATNLPVSLLLCIIPKPAKDIWAIGDTIDCSSVNPDKKLGDVV